MSCGAYLKEAAENPSACSAYGFWIAGFVTGANAAKDRMTSTDAPAAQAWVDNYCRENPLDLFVMATVRLDEELDRRAGKKHK